MIFGYKNTHISKEKLSDVSKNLSKLFGVSNNNYYLCSVINQTRINMENAVIYARVSTQGQDYDRQVEELRAYAQRNDYQIVAEFTEKISGAKKVDERNAMSEMLDYVTSNDVKRVLVYECSRISRRAADFLNIIDYLTEHKISLYIHQNGLGNPAKRWQCEPHCSTCFGHLTGYSVKAKSKDYYKCNKIGCKHNQSVVKMHNKYIGLLDSYGVPKEFRPILKKVLTKLFDQSN